MNRISIAPGAHLTAVVGGERFKRFKINIHLVVPGQRATATAMALLPHILERRCAAVPDPMQLSRRLFDLYGAELTGESYAAGQNRVVTLGITGLKNEFALEGEDLAGDCLRLLLNLVFEPLLEYGVFSAEDVQIETAKQADHLKNERNDKRGYCIRQARRKLYKNSPLGIESAGYLEDIDSITPALLYNAYLELLRTAQIEVVVCGADADAAAKQVAECLGAHQRQPVAPAPLVAADGIEGFPHYTEAMDTAQGKFCILLTSGEIPDAEGDAVMRMASAALGGLATSRFHRNVREKQSLCYYAACIYGAFSGTLQFDSGVDHENATRAAMAMLHELEGMQAELVSEEEWENTRLALKNSFAAAGDSPEALCSWAFTELLRGTMQTLDEAAKRVNSVTREQMRDALQKFTPAVQYSITAKEDG